MAKSDPVTYVKLFSWDFFCLLLLHIMPTVQYSYTYVILEFFSEKIARKLDNLHLSYSLSVSHLLIINTLNISIATIIIDNNIFFEYNFSSFSLLLLIDNIFSLKMYVTCKALELIILLILFMWGKPWNKPNSRNRWFTRVRCILSTEKDEGLEVTWTRWNTLVRI